MKTLLIIFISLIIGFIPINYNNSKTENVAICNTVEASNPFNIFNNSNARLRITPYNSSTYSRNVNELVSVNYGGVDTTNLLFKNIVPTYTSGGANSSVDQLYTWELVFDLSSLVQINNYSIDFYGLGYGDYDKKVSWGLQYFFGYTPNGVYIFTDSEVKQLSDTGDYKLLPTNYNQFSAIGVRCSRSAGTAFTASQDAWNGLHFCRNIVLNDSDTDIYDTGYNVGYDTGYDAGYNAGYTIGSAETALSPNGLFYGAIELMKGLGNILYNFFSIKIVGDFNLAFFVFGIPLTFMILKRLVNLIMGFLGQKE